MQSIAVFEEGHNGRTLSLRLYLDHRREGSRGQILVLAWEPYLQRLRGVNKRRESIDESLVFKGEMNLSKTRIESEMRRRKCPKALEVLIKLERELSRPLT